MSVISRSMRILTQKGIFGNEFSARGTLAHSINESTLQLCVPVRFSSNSDIKRFYKNVTITQQESQFEINLDRKKLKTPMGKLLRLPSEGLALAVAAEWDQQRVSGFSTVFTMSAW